MLAIDSASCIDVYRFGFNTQEKLNEIAGIGNHMTAKFWEYDTRLGRRWNLDPKPQISISDYAVLGNNPIWYNDVLGDIKNKNGKENSKQNPETLQEVVIKPQKQIPNSEVNATGGLFGGGGEMNLMQAAAKDVGRNDANREKADMAHQAVGLMMAMGAAPIAGVAAVEAGVGAWALNNLVLNGGKIAAWNIAGGAGDLTYQLATKDVKDVNFASVGSNALFGPLPSAFLGYTFNVSVNSLSGTKPTVVNPFNGAGLLNIGVGTMTNYGAGKLGEFLGIPTIRVGNVSAPNVLGPSLNMGANAAGNAAGTEIVNQVESK